MSQKKEQSENVNLQKISAILEAVFTDKKGSTRNVDNEKKLKKMSKGNITKKEKVAWLKAGMPNPKEFFTNYRKENG